MSRASAQARQRARKEREQAKNKPASNAWREAMGGVPTNSKGANAAYTKDKIEKNRKSSEGKAKATANNISTRKAEAQRKARNKGNGNGSSKSSSTTKSSSTPTRKPQSKDMDANYKAWAKANPTLAKKVKKGQAGYKSVKGSSSSQPRNAGAGNGAPGAQSRPTTTTKGSVSKGVKAATKKAGLKVKSRLSAALDSVKKKKK